MRVFYWSKKQLAKALLIMSALLVTAMIGYDLMQDDMAVSTLTTQPIYQGDPNYKKMVLTINVDWGGEYIPDMLQIFKQNNANVTFFVTGRFATKFPEIIKKIASEGHEIGNHGYSHPHPDKISKKENQDEIKKTEQAIYEACGVQTVYFAPPYGEHKPHVVEAAEEIGYKTIMWTIDTVDWDKSKQPSHIYQKVVANAQNGAIVLMHPTDRTVQALNDIITNLKQEGYELTTLTKVLP